MWEQEPYEFEDYKGFVIEKLQFQLVYEDKKEWLEPFWGARKGIVCFGTRNTKEEIKKLVDSIANCESGI